MDKTCSLCSGSGQISYFGGESRFLLTWRECPACCGTGFADAPTVTQQERSQAELDDSSDSAGDESEPTL